MAFTTHTGRGGTTVKITWRGAEVAQTIDRIIQDALEDEQREVEQDLQARLHRITGQMADESFAEVVISGGRRELRAGSRAPHTSYHEFGTANFEGHPQIREIIDEHAPHVTQRLRARFKI